MCEEAWHSRAAYGSVLKDGKRRCTGRFRVPSRDLHQVGRRGVCSWPSRVRPASTGDRCGPLSLQRAEVGKAGGPPRVRHSSRANWPGKWNYPGPGVGRRKRLVFVGRTSAILGPTHAPSCCRYDARHAGEARANDKVGRANAFFCHCAKPKSLRRTFLARETWLVCQCILPRREDDLD